MMKIPMKKCFMNARKNKKKTGQKINDDQIFTLCRLEHVHGCYVERTMLVLVALKCDHLGIVPTPH